MAKDKMTRTMMTLPSSLKARMSRADTDWSEVIREMISQRLEGGQRNMAEAVTLNERVKRSARWSWSSLKMIKH